MARDRFVRRARTDCATEAPRRDDDDSQERGAEHRTHASDNVTIRYDGYDRSEEPSDARQLS